MIRGRSDLSLRASFPISASSHCHPPPRSGDGRVPSGRGRGRAFLRPTRRQAKRVLALFGVVLHAATAHAGRPLITDDAGVVGDHLAQLETWLYLDRNQIDHAVGVAFGPTEWMEASVGGVHGLTRASRPKLGARGPIAQVKMLFVEPRTWPGLALATGAATPLGFGHLEPAGWLAYAYLASTWNLFDGAAALHVNAGAAGLEGPELGFVSGVAAVTAVLAPVSLFTELYRGDTYDARVRMIAVHGGAFWAVTESVQVDATLGTTLPAMSGSNERALPWATLGLKLVSGRL
jgi:hypothetical protein